MQKPSTESTETRESSENKLLRLLYIVLFYVIYSMTDVIFALITIVQSVLNLFAGGPSETLREFGSSLAVYVRQIGDYLSYTRDLKPFPFSDWPEPDLGDENMSKK